MGLLSDILKEIPTTAHERMALAMQRAAVMEVEIVRLNDENARLTGELIAAQRLIPRRDFLESRGVLFKRKPSGGFEPDAYCPKCEVALSALEAFLPMECSKCKLWTPFKKCELAAIVAGLPGV